MALPGFHRSAGRGAEPLASRSARAERAVLVVAIGSVAIFWLAGPLFGYDLFRYHLPYSAHVLNCGRLPLDVERSVFDLAHAYPPLVYLGYAVTWVLLGCREHGSVRLVALIFLAGTVLLPPALARRREDGWAASLLLFTSAPLVATLHFVGTDLPLLYLCLAWALLVRSYLDTGRQGDLILASVHLALALWTKYQALTLWVAALPALLVLRVEAAESHGWSHRGRPPGWPQVLTAHVAALVAFVPLLARNWRDLGNPLHPALAGWIGGQGLDPWTVTHLVSAVQLSPGLDPARAAAGLGIVASVVSFWLLVHPASRPWRRSDRFLAATAFAFVVAWLVLWVQPHSHPGRFLLPAACLAAVVAAPAWSALRGAARDHGPARALLVAGLTSCTLATWAAAAAGVGSLQQRIPWPVSGLKGAYWIAAFILRDGQLLLLAVALVVHRARPGRGTSVALALTLSGGLLFTCADKLRWTAVEVARHGSLYGLRYDPEMAEYAWMDARLPRSARLLTVGGLADCFPRPSLPAESGRMRSLHQAATAQEVSAIVKRCGVTHVFIDAGGGGAHMFPVIAGGSLLRALRRPDLFEQLLELRGTVRIYRVR